MANQDIRVSTEWEHSITNLLGHAPTTEPGIALRQWVLHQGVENHLDLLSWEEEEIKANPTQQVFSLDEHGQGSYLRTNQTKQLCGLITYMKHIFSEYMSTGVRPDPFHPFSPEEWSHQTSTMMRTFLVQNLPTPIGPEPVTSGPIPSSKPATYSPAALELMSFKKGIKREITAYPSLKDERYFDGFKRSLFIVAKTHECSDVLDPNYTDGYTMPLTCKVGLMYLSIIGKPTDQDLERYPAVHLTGPHEWDPSVLDYTHPSGDGEPPWSNDPVERYAFDPNFDEFGDYTQRAIQTFSILDDSSSTLTPSSNYIANQHDFRTYQHAVKHEAPDYEKFRLILVGLM